MNSQFRHTSSVADQAEIYNLLLHHGAYIDRVCVGLFGGIKRSEDRDEARGELFLRLVEGYAKLRLNDARNRDSVVRSWIYFQALGVQKSMGRAFRKSTRERSAGDVFGDGISGGSENYSSPAQRDFARKQGDLTSLSEDGHGRVESRHDARIVVEAIFAEATPKQREACMSVMLEMDSAEMDRRYGMSVAQRTDRINSLRARVSHLAAVLQ